MLTISIINFGAHVCTACTCTVDQFQFAVRDCQTGSILTLQRHQVATCVQLLVREYYRKLSAALYGMILFQLSEMISDSNDGRAL